MGGNYCQPFSLRISEEMRYNLRGVADAHRRSENREIESVLGKYIKGYESGHGVIPEDPIGGNRK